MDAVYPAAASALERGRRRRRAEPRPRRRTAPVTFAEIEEVDEEPPGEAVPAASGADERRRRPDVLDERLGREFLEFRKRRARRHQLREPDEPPAGPPPAGPPSAAAPSPAASASPARAASEPRPTADAS